MSLVWTTLVLLPALAMVISTLGGGAWFGVPLALASVGTLSYGLWRCRPWAPRALQGLCGLLGLFLVALYVRAPTTYDGLKTLTQPFTLLVLVATLSCLRHTFAGGFAELFRADAPPASQDGRWAFLLSRGLALIIFFGIWANACGVPRR